MPEFFLRPVLRILAESDKEATEKIYNALTPAGIQIRGWEGEPEEKKEYPVPKSELKKKHYEPCPECGQETFETIYDDPRHGGLDHYICHNPNCRGI